MEAKILKLMVKIAHTIQALDILSERLEDVYNILSDKEFLAYLDCSHKTLDKEDYE